ncbi:MAG: hypothetical protein JXA66_09385 [Oligoflexia bacterium]|nr:hypothetical protein [Oligoflexia bacterium]
MKKYLAVIFVLCLASCLKQEKKFFVQSSVELDQKSFGQAVERGMDVYKIEMEITNRSSYQRVKALVLKANLYNRESVIIASKLVPVRPERMVPGTNKLISLDEMPRRKLNRANSLMPSETISYDVFFYREDLEASPAIDKVPVSGSVVVHSGMLID